MATAETRNATGGNPAASLANSGPAGPGVHSGAIVPRASRADKQAVIDRIRAALPELLTADRWVCWRSIPDPDPTKKPRKMPVNPHTGGNASSTNPATWATFAQAAGWYLRHDVSGLGFVLGDGWAGIDMDDCVDDGNLSPFTWRVIERMNSYAELSPSGKGVHILARGEPGKALKTETIEVYSHGRYFTVTGRAVTDSHIEARPAELQALVAEYAPKTNGTNGRAPIIGSAPGDAYLGAALVGEARRVAMALDGGRNDTLNRAAFSLATIPDLHESVIEGALLSAALQSGLGEPEARATIDSGVKAGRLHPRALQAQRPARRLATWTETPEQAPVIGEPAPAGAQSPEDKPKRRRITSDDLIDFLRSNGFDFRLNLCDDSIEVNQERITDVHTAKMRCLLRDAGLGKYLAAADDALVAYAASHAYHPVRQYLDGLVWDGFQHIGQLAGHVRDVHGVFGLFLRSWLIGAVNRAMTGGQNAVFVLDGLQGVGKSQLARWLCPLPGFFVDGPVNPDDKDTSLMAMRTWVWELSELGATVRRADVESLKSFLSRETFTVRPPFGHFEIKKPGLASFIGTVNESAGIFSDPTGSRRFWATTVTAIDWVYARRVDVNQVWAEAVHAYRQGESWVLTPEDAKNASAINEGFAVPDAVELLLRKWFVLGAADDNWLSTADILTTLQDNGLGQNARANAMHLAATMKKLGLRKGDFAKQRGYYGVLRSVLPVARQG